MLAAAPALVSRSPAGRRVRPGAGQVSAVPARTRGRRGSNVRQGSNL